MKTTYTIRNSSNTNASKRDIARAKSAFRRFYNNPAKCWGKHYGTVIVKFTDVNGVYKASFINERFEKITESFIL